MRPTLIAAVIAALGLAGPAVAGDEALAPDEMRKAIEMGRTASQRQLEQYVLQVAPTWTVNFDTPFLRLAQFSHARRKAGHTIVEGGVPPNIVRPQVHVYALAVQQADAAERPRSIVHVTIRKPGGLEMIQPVYVRTNVNRSRARGDFRRAGLARSVEGVFSQRDFAAGNELCLHFEGGGQERIPITREGLAAAR